MIKKSLFIIIAVFLISLNLFSTYIVALEEQDIVATSAILIDKKTGRVLWKKNSDQKMAMASTTKIMTCIIALENADLDQVVKVSKLATKAPPVKLYIKEDEEYKLEDLLYALMLESSNDVAVAIAEGVSGSVEEFCNTMTKKAKEIGAMNTSYKTPNGLDAEGHYTTAYDLALITRYALNNEKFCEIINTSSHNFNELTKGKNITVNNKNSFLNIYEGANGVKTGFTGQAGYCFVGSAKRDDLELISVVLACSWPPNKTYRWADTKKLLDYGFENYEYKTIFENTKIVSKIDNIKYGIGDDVEGFIDESVNFILKEDEKINIVYNVNNIVEAPIYKNEVIGKADIYINNDYYDTVNIKATKTVERINYKYCVRYVTNIFVRFLEENNGDTFAKIFS